MITNKGDIYFTENGKTYEVGYTVINDKIMLFLSNDILKHSDTIKTQIKKILLKNQ